MDMARIPPVRTSVTMHMTEAASLTSTHSRMALSTISWISASQVSLRVLPCLEGIYHPSSPASVRLRASTWRR